MTAALWPLILVVAANILYNIASKSLPPNYNPYAALVGTYLAAASISLLAFFLSGGKALGTTLLKMDWTPIALGISMVGLEIGYIFIYRAGWKISVASLLANILLAVALLFIGLAFYRERLNFQQILGISLCMAGCLVLMAARQ